MTSWKESSLGEVCELYQPKTLSSAELVQEGAYLVYGANGVIGRHNEFNHETAEVMVTCRGATCGTVNVSEPKSWINGNAMVVKPRNGALDFNFLQHLLRGGVDFSAAITGAAQPQITRQSLAPIRFSYPEPPEQRRIAAILDKAEVLRTKRHEALAQLGRLAQAIFVEMFGDPTTNPNGWHRKRLDELVPADDSINYGVVQPGDDVEQGVPLVRVGDLLNGNVRHEALKRIAPEIERAYQRSRLKGDEILVSCVGTVGVVALASHRERGFNIARAVARIRVGGETDREFVAAQLGTNAVQRYFTQELRTVSQPTLNIKQIAETQMLCPPLTMQREFASRLNAVRANRARLIESSELTEAMIRSIQHRAFRGEL